MCGLRAVLLSQLVSTLGMAGVIWFVQIVHYPLFAGVGEAGFRGYAARHATRTTWIVFPLMMTELVSAGMLLSPGFRFAQIPAWQAWLGAVLVGVIWLSTGLVQVPLHDRLQAGGGAVEVRRLVTTNWVRTLAWSARSGLVLCWAYRLLIRV